jgi:hypothetical protein
MDAPHIPIPSTNPAPKYVFRSYTKKPLHGEWPWRRQHWRHWQHWQHGQPTAFSDTFRDRRWLMLPWRGSSCGPIRKQARDGNAMLRPIPLFRTTVSPHPSTRTPTSTQQHNQARRVRASCSHSARARLQHPGHHLQATSRPPPAQLQRSSSTPSGSRSPWRRCARSCALCRRRVEKGAHAKTQNQPIRVIEARLGRFAPVGGSRPAAHSIPPPAPVPADAMPRQLILPPEFGASPTQR